MSEVDSKNLEQLTAPASGAVACSTSFPLILDACCGSRTFWFQKENPFSVFIDKRIETLVADVGTPGTRGRKPIIIKPNIQADFCALPFKSDMFHMVVFDPPHMTSLGKNSILAKKYGRLIGSWDIELRQGFSECFRVLRPSGLTEKFPPNAIL